MRDTLNNIVGKARSLPKAQRIGISAGFASITAIPVLFLLLQNEPSYRLLVKSGVENTSEIVEALEGSQVLFDVRSNGSIWVADRDMGKANMLLAKAGYPDYATTSYDLLLENDSLYMSQNKEALLGRQILEENLAAAISSIEGVKRAHVRLALASETSFLREDQPSSASVVVVMDRSLDLDKQQVKAIGSLVSSGVKNLPLENVKIINQNGRLLSDFGDEDLTGAKGAEVSGDREREFDRKAKKHLHAMFGYDGITVTSTFDINFDKVRNTTKEPIESTVVLSRQVEKRYDGEDGVTRGIPGSTSNQPPGQAGFEGGVDGGGGASSSSGGETYLNEITNYEVGTSITNTEFQVGNVENVNVVSIIDGRRVTEEEEAAVVEEVTEALTRLSPVPEQTTVSVIVRDFAEFEVPEQEVNFWQTPQAVSIFEIMINKGLVAFIALLAYLIAGRFLRTKEEDEEEEEVAHIDEDSDEENTLSHEDLTEQLLTMVNDQPRQVTEAMRSVMLENETTDKAKDDEK